MKKVHVHPPTHSHGTTVVVSNPTPAAAHHPVRAVPSHYHTPHVLFPSQVQLQHQHTMNSSASHHHAAPSTHTHGH